MIAKTLRKLVPALLMLALVLPCALTVPVSATDEAVGYTTVTEADMRQIVVNEAKKTAEFQWTAGEDILTLNPLGATGSTTKLQALLYQSGATVYGPVYSRYNAASREQLQAVYGETYTRTDVNGDGVVDHKDTYGMHCATFVFDTISRVSDNYTAYGCHNAVDNEKLKLLVDGIDTTGMTKTSQIFEAASQDAIYAAYDKLQAGDILNSYDGAGHVHIRIVKSVDKNNKTVTCYEEASNPWYYAADGSYTNVVTTVENSDKKNELPAGTTEASVVIGLKTTYGTQMDAASYVQSARVDATYGYDTLMENLYAPYTLTDYAEGKVENADVDIVLTGKAGESDYSKGFTLDVTSNYRIIKVELKLTGDNGEYTHTLWGGNNASTAYELSFDSASVARLNEHQVDETLTVTVTSGPVTTVGGEVPTTSIEPITIEANAQALRKIAGATTLESGYYYLSDESAEAAGVITISGDVTLCLHGNTLTKTHPDRMFTLTSADAVLTICDCDGSGTLTSSATGGVCIGVNAGTVNIQGGTITGFNAAAGAIFLNGGNGTMSGGTITGNTSSGNGGGVTVNVNASEFTMDGGVITDNTAASGGGVYNNGTFKMNGGKITDNNTTSGNGGGVGNGRSFYMYGGEISGNNAASLGGGIHNSYCAYLYQGTISDNTAANGGGASTTSSELYLFAGSSKKGVTVTGNTATTNGGGLYSSASNGSIKIKGGTISNNTASGNGGGVYFAGGNATGLMMYDEGGTILIDGNKAVNGAGVYVTAYATSATDTETQAVTWTGKEVKFTMNAGTISNNTATGNGGGVFVSGNNDAGVNGTFKMNGGEISGNTAVNGGGVRNDSARGYFYLYGGEISGNTATGTETGNGGGLDNRYIAHLYGGEISENTATTNGGGVNTTSTTLTLNNDVLISGNLATTGGGINLVYASTKVTMNGGTVSANRAVNGAGISVGSGTFTMKGGLIGGDGSLEQSNLNIKNASDASVAGIALYITSGTANLEGGAIAGNKCGVTGDVTVGTETVAVKRTNPVHVLTGTVNLSGTEIYGNEGSWTGGVWLNSSGADLVMTGGSIGMNGDTNAPNKEMASSGALSTFYQNNTGAVVTISGGKLYGSPIVKSGTTNITVTGGQFTWNPATYVSDETHEVRDKTLGSTLWYHVIEKVTATVPEGWTELPSAGGALAEGKYILTGNVEISTGFTIAAEVTVDLNGYDIISSVTGEGTNAWANGKAFTVNANGHLKLQDSSGKTGELRMKSGTKAGCAIYVAGGKATMYSGGITGFNAMPIYMAWSTFTLEGGDITGNSNMAKHGAAFYLESDNANLIVNGGRVFGNTTAGTGNGGAIYVGGSKTGKIYVNGGLIDGTASVGTVCPNGGAIVSMSKGTATITGGEIIGALYETAETQTITITGGKFSEDPASFVADTSRCKDINRDEGNTDPLKYLVVVKPKFTGSIVNLGNTLGLKFYVNVDKADTLDDYTVTLTRGDSTQTVTLGDSDTIEGGSTHMYFYTGIAAKEMCDEVTMTIKCGEDEMNSLAVSVRSNAEGLLGMTEYSKWYTTLVDMLNYGAAAQTYFDHNTGDLANKNLTEAQQALATQTDPTCSSGASSNLGTGNFGSIVSLEDNIVMKMLFAKSVVGDATEATVSYTGYNATEATQYTAAVEPYSDDYVMVVVDELVVGDARQEVTCTIGEYSGTDSVEYYTARAAGSDAAAVTKAMMKFADSAKAALTGGQS